MTITIGVALDYLGVGFFALSGALAAARRRQDLVTFLFFGAITGIGGGTLRDLLIGAPVFWVRQPGYIIVCGVGALLVWLSRGRGMTASALHWIDALGLSAYAVVGAAKAEAAGVAAPVCVVMGVLTACFGGVMRDVLAEQPSALLRRDVYVTASIAAAGTYVAATLLAAPHLIAATLGFGLGVVIRGGALARGWRLPAFEPSAPGAEGDL
jgi:uncharacterized membrane protein YeiH